MVDFFFFFRLRSCTFLGSINSCLRLMENLMFLIVAKLIDCLFFFKNGTSDYVVKQKLN